MIRSIAITGRGGVDENFFKFSWFVIGVFALDWSKECLLGVEPAMLESRRWEVPNFSWILRHNGGNWSGLRKSFKWFLRSLFGEDKHPLWRLFAFLSFFAFMAMLLSGLSFGIEDGYIPLNDPAMGIGYTWAEFNRRQEQYYQSGALSAWQAHPSVFTGTYLKVPGPKTPTVVNARHQRAIALLVDGC
jgi:hypothetical protein